MAEDESITGSLEAAQGIGQIAVIGIVALLLWRILDTLQPAVKFGADTAETAVNETAETFQDSGLMHNRINAGMGEDSLVGAPPNVPVYEEHYEVAADDPVMLGTGLPLTDRLLDLAYGGQKHDSYTVEVSSEDRFDEPTRRGGGRIT